MFDTTIVRSGPTHVTVDERRAPTDDSIRLAREYEDRAAARVLATLCVTGNGLEGWLVQSGIGVAGVHVTFACFKLNGKDYQVKVEEEWPVLCADKLARYRALADAVAREVSKEIVSRLLMSEGVRK